MRRCLLAVIALFIMLLPATAAAQQKTHTTFGPPIAFVGGGYSRSGSVEFGGEVWFPIPRSTSSDSAWMIEALGAFDLKDQKKIGAGFGVMSDSFYSLDVRGFVLATDNQGGAGLSVGLGLWFGSQVPGIRIRPAFDWVHVDGKSQPGVSLLVQIGPFGAK